MILHDSLPRSLPLLVYSAFAPGYQLVCLQRLRGNREGPRGVPSIAEILEDAQEATISVRGRSKYVVISVQQYPHLRECELEAALLEARKDREAGRIAGGRIAEHIAGLKN
jgi:hypothetical protein